MIFSFALIKVSVMRKPNSSKPASSKLKTRFCRQTELEANCDYMKRFSDKQINGRDNKIQSISVISGTALNKSATSP